MIQIVGLTGGIASGKSTVSDLFKGEDIPVIDTDKIARELLETGSDAYNEVVSHFSSEILFANGEINRKLLGKLIFSNPKRRDVLNGIIHPRVLEIMRLEIKQCEEKGESLVVIDVPLLFESGFDKECHKTIVVFTTPEKQLSRLMDRDQIDEEYASVKIAAQMPLSEKVKKADFVIDNSQSILETKKDFLQILEQLEVS